MTIDDIKKAMANGFDRVLGLPRLLLHQSDRALIYANQQYWQKASDAEWAALLASIPNMAEAEKLHSTAPEK